LSWLIIILQDFTSIEIDQVRTEVKYDEPWLVSQDVYDVHGITYKGLHDEERSIFKLGRQGESTIKYCKSNHLSSL